METHSLSTANHQLGSFKTYVQSQVEKFRPLQLFCCAKSITSNETTGCFANHRDNDHCDYCLLMVTVSITFIGNRAFLDRSARYVNSVQEICAIKFEELEHQEMLHKELHGESEVKVD